MQLHGYGVIEYSGNHFKLIDSGAIETKKGVPFPKRIQKIYDDMMLLIEQYKPDAIAVEELFFNTNITTGIQVAHGRGAVIIAASKTDTPIFEYTPLEVKQAVVGYGRADKKQVQMMVKAILNLEKIPKLDDTTDAIAIAICHAHSSKFATPIE
jgi:crossover junction endodeoxyribonuclease RuvC